jgi:uncharacterized protein (TIGR02147 family)
MALQGKRHLSKDIIYLFCEKLKLTSEETVVLLLLSDLDRAKSSKLRSRLKKRLTEIESRIVMTPLQDSQFAAIAHWYGLAILEALKSGQCDSDVRSLSLHLGVPELEIERVLKQLIEMCVLSPTHEVLLPHIAFDSKVPNRVFINYYLELLEHSKATLQEGKKPSRVATKTIAIDPDDLPLVEAEMDKLIARLRIIANRSKNKSKLYCFYSHCFPFVTPKQ